MLGAFAWLVGVSASLTSLRGQIPGAPPPAASDLTASLACVAQNGVIPAGTPLSPASIPSSGLGGVRAGVRAGSGTTAYVGAKHLSFTAATPKAPAVLALDADTVLMVYTVTTPAVASYAVVLSAAAAGDWVAGDTTVVGGSSGVTPQAVPVRVDEMEVLSTWSATADAMLVFAGSGSVVAATLSQATRTLTFGAPAVYTAGFTVDTQLAVLTPPYFFVSYFDTNAATGVVGLFGRVGSATVSGTPTVALGAATVVADNHVTRAVAGIPGGAGGAGVAVMIFTADNATAATDDDYEEVGFSVGAVLVLAAPDLSATVWGESGPVPSAPATTTFAEPWYQHGLRAHFFMDLVAAGTRASDGAQLFVAAAVDAASSNAIVTTSLWVSAASTPATLLWADVTRQTAGASLTYYTRFALTPLRANPTAAAPAGADSAPLLFAYSDAAAGGVPTMAVASVSFIDGSLCLIAAPMPLALSAPTTTVPIAATAVANGVAILLHATGASSMNVTLVEVGTPAVAVAAAPAMCTAGVPSTTALPAAMYGGAAVDSSVWLQPRAPATVAPGTPLFATSRGAITTSLATTYYPPAAPAGGAAVRVVVPPTSQFALAGRTSASLLVLPELSILDAAPPGAVMCAPPLPPYA